MTCKCVYAIMDADLQVRFRRDSVHHGRGVAEDPVLDLHLQLQPYETKGAPQVEFVKAMGSLGCN